MSLFQRNSIQNKYGNNFEKLFCMRKKILQQVEEWRIFSSSQTFLKESFLSVNSIVFPCPFGLEKSKGMKIRCLEFFALILSQSEHSSKVNKSLKMFTPRNLIFGKKAKCIYEFLFTYALLLQTTPFESCCHR